MYSLARRIYNNNSPEKDANAESAAIRAAHQAFNLLRDEAPMLPALSAFPGIGAHGMETAVRHVHTAIRSHYENAKFLGVDTTKSSVIAKFFRLNDQEHRYADFPKAKFSPSTIT
ncbi:hypothetical protein DFQ27_002901, partial [Actinomortierella ambigua]